MTSSRLLSTATASLMTGSFLRTSAATVARWSTLAWDSPWRTGWQPAVGWPDRGRAPRTQTPHRPPSAM